MELLRIERGRHTEIEDSLIIRRLLMTADMGAPRTPY